MFTKSIILCIVILILFPINTYGINLVSSEITDVIELIRLYAPYNLSHVSRLGSIVSANPGNWVDILIHHELSEDLISPGLDYEIVDDDVDDVSEAIISTYHTLSEMEDILRDISRDFSSISSLFSIGKSYEERDIWCLEISDNPSVDENEPGVLFMGMHHAREWPTMEICLSLAQNLTDQYQTNDTIKRLVNNRRIWIIPCVNPDGYYFSHDDNIKHDWRKNRHYFPTYGTYGVDLNRNYDGSVNGDAQGMWGSVGIASVSHNPIYETYCGQTASSEYETNIIKQFFIEHDISASISYHTYGQYVMWPWGYSDDFQIPDIDLVSSIGRSIAYTIHRQDGSGVYTPMQAVDLYPTVGDFADWAYGYSHYVLGKVHAAYTIEACTEFHPSEEYLSQICSENLNGAFVLLESAETLYQQTPRVIPPSIQKVTVQARNYTITWMERNPSAKPTKFHINEYINVTLSTDTSESDENHWVLDGFLKSTEKSHSADTCYATISSNARVNSMISVLPLPVNVDTLLSFWCWFDIEENMGMAFIEVSTNNRSYTILDTFTGSSNGWMYKQYSLSEYSGSSLFIRFRYTTDRINVNDGFYVDDISPVPRFQEINTISEDITEHSISFENKPIGAYYYQVRGYNEKYGWGDFSSLKKVLVGIHENVAPYSPTIDGKAQGKKGVEYSYAIQSTDEEEDDIYYFVDWGDGTNSEWQGPFESGEVYFMNHSWTEKGDFIMKAKAKDVYDQESDFSTLQVSMPFIPLKNNDITGFLKDIFYLYRFLFKFPFNG